MIRHAAIFKLKHAKGSDEEKRFLAAIRGLKSIPGVERFELARETSSKNDFDFSVSMYFKDEAAYESYNVHPLHVAFVEGRWIPEVARFMEHDTVALIEEP
jgi:heme-degrading monooxygenase HmoA